jgi:Ti-type conjugative transfer relaxase TraA
MYSMHIGIISRSKASTVDALAYRAGVKLECPLTGEIFNRESKEVEDVQLSLPKDAPQWAVDLKELIDSDRTKGVQEFCNIVEGAETRKDSQVYREFRISIPREFTKEQGKEFINDFVQDQVCGLGITALKNFHFDVNEETGETNPHCHVIALTRGLTETGLGLKERDWNKKQVHEQWRSQLSAYGNYHLLKNGFEANWDHRSYKDRGINFEPQPKLGSKIIKMESQAGQDPKSIYSKPVTERGREYQEVKLRNLYTLINRPEEALDSVSKQQVTFMWGDVAKVIARYVDDQALFERLSLKIQNSPELVCLQKEGSFTESIFTTRTRLAEEKKFVDTINALKGNENHGVNASLVEASIEKANIQLRESKNDPKASLSDDQVNAIKHMSLANQLSFVEGYAGAGKTTVMKVMKEIWETSGYQVFGLAPTGKAAENLADCGISSDTVHSFLKSFEHGRSQYDSKTIIVLDEAGMVDHQRFHGLIQAVEKLGIKLVASGDRGQLSPVEAGVPFRLAVAEAGKADLTTVLRQKVPWQKEATVLFGQGRAEEALKAYLDKGHIHFCDEKKPRDVVEQYNLSRRIAGNMGHEIQKDIKIAKERGEPLTFSSHTDYGLFLEWKNTRDACVKDLYGNIETYRDQMRNLGVDGIDFAKKVMKCRLASFGDAYALAKDLKIDWRDKAKHSCDPRFETKQRLIADWFQSTKAHPSDSQAMMAFSNKDVQELNGMARDLKRGAGDLGKEEYIYTIERNAGEELGRPQTVREERRFSVGDQIVFTKIDKGLGVNNGTLGRVTELSKSNIKVAIEKDGVSQEISFSPNLYKRFDNGWAVTIHKNQGATVDLAFVLASFEQYKNLAYVALTRHAKNVQVYASRFEFWRDEKLPERLGHAQDKLSSLDYVSSDRALELLQSDEKMLGSSLKKVGQRLEAVGYVGQRAWSTVCDKFLGRPVESNLVRIDRDIENLKSEADRAAEKFNPTPERDVGDHGQALGPQQGLYKPEGNSKVKGVEAERTKTTNATTSQPRHETIISGKEGANRNLITHFTKLVFEPIIFYRYQSL